MENLSLKDAIVNRKSVKVFDPAVKISEEEMKEMIGLATEAPSSINLQPWRFVIVESDEAKESIKHLVRFNTRQLETSSAFVLVLSDDNHANFTEKIFNKNVELGYMDEETKNKNYPALKGLIDQAPKEYLKVQGMMDASMAAIQFMLVAKDFGYDTNPIGGFERTEVMEALNIDSSRYSAVMFIAIGKGVKDPHHTSRFSADELLSFNHGNDGIVGTLK